jgi:YHS domain-containing protein
VAGDGCAAAHGVDGAPEGRARCAVATAAAADTAERSALPVARQAPDRNFPDLPVARAGAESDTRAAKTAQPHPRSVMSEMSSRRTSVAAALALAGVLCAQHQEPAPKADSKPPKAAFVQKSEVYPLDTCVVSGEKLDDEAVTFTAGGQTFRTCCTKCQAKVEKDPAAFAKKVEAAAIASQTARYALTTCPVSGEKLGAMGEPVPLMLDGTLVKLSCPHCTDKAKAKAAEIVAKVREAAYAAQLAHYAPTTCPVSGEKLEKDAVSVMFGTTLVRFCCEKCAAKFEAKPAEYLPKLRAAATSGKEKPKDEKAKDEKAKEAPRSGK